MRRLSWLLALLLYSLSVAQAQTLPRETRERIIRSTVMILPTGDDGKLTGSLGSGTLISPLGYILTNYHVVGDIEERKVSEWLQIRVIRFVDTEQYKEVGACTARLTALATPIPNPTSLKWPVKPVVGQTWTFIIQNGGVWTVKLTEPDKQGDPRGEATSAKGETWAVFFYRRQAGYLYGKPEVEGSEKRGSREILNPTAHCPLNPPGSVPA